jgi:hypothetical protein
MSGWSRLKEGFCSMWRALYPSDPVDWYAQVGRILGVISLVGVWKLVGEGIIELFKWVVT